MIIVKLFFLMCMVFASFINSSFAQEQTAYTIIIKDHKFSPVQLNVPTGQKFKLIVDNQDPTPEEFESYPLNREKVVLGGKKILIYLGPLKEGSYEYFGEFHKQTAKGVIVAQ